jgi:hypothetical protein
MLSRDVLRDLGICACCGKPLHDTRNAFRARTSSKKKNYKRVATSHEQKHDVKEQTGDFDLAAMVRFIEGKQATSKNAAATQRARPKPRTRRDPFDKNVEEFGRKLDSQHRNTSGKMRLVMAENAEMKLIELCK